jgi:hypothetical protein
MVDRILKVNAYTTFDLLDAEVEGHSFSEEALAVLNVTTDSREDPDQVEIQLELDNTELSAVPAHADTVVLSAAQARELASELETYANRIDGDD